MNFNPSVKKDSDQFFKRSSLQNETPVIFIETLQALWSEHNRLFKPTICTVWKTFFIGFRNFCAHYSFCIGFSTITKPQFDPGDHRGSPTCSSADGCLFTCFIFPSLFFVVILWHFFAPEVIPKLIWRGHIEIEDFFLKTLTLTMNSCNFSNIFMKQWFMNCISQYQKPFSVLSLCSYLKPEVVLQ